MSNARVTPNIKSQPEVLPANGRAMLRGQNHPASLPQLRLSRVIAFVDANVGRDLCVSTLASIAGMSPYHFCRSFKQNTGVTPHQYVLRRRMEQARYLLEGKTLPLMEIARQVGFTDQSQFTRVFHKMVGMTPSQYRKESIQHSAISIQPRKHSAVGK